MKAKLNGIFIVFSVIGAIVFILATTGAAALEAARGGRRATSSQGQNDAQGGQALSRQTLAGMWRLNRGQSDDPARKIVSDDDIPLGGAGSEDWAVGQLGGVPDANSLGMGSMSGMGAIGGGAPAMPQAPPSHHWETDKDRQKKLEDLMPANSLTIEQKDNEFDFVDDLSRKQMFCTDGSKLRKSKDDKPQEFAARWDGGRLTYNEKRPPRGTITRTFELSPDSRQLLETIEVDNGSISVPIVIRYVYDAVPASTQP